MCSLFYFPFSLFPFLLLGLVAQQQCIGPLHTPLADFAMIALTHFDVVGAATSIGEQPMKGLISCGANARMSVAEAITNIMFAKITCLEVRKFTHIGTDFFFFFLFLTHLTIGCQIQAE